MSNDGFRKKIILPSLIKGFTRYVVYRRFVNGMTRLHRLFLYRRHIAGDNERTRKGWEIRERARGSDERVRLSRGKGRTWSSPRCSKAVSSSKGYSHLLLYATILIKRRFVFVIIPDPLSCSRRLKMGSYSRNNASYFWNFIRRIPRESFRIKYFRNQLFLFVSRIALRKERETLQFSIPRSLRLHDLEDALSRYSRCMQRCRKPAGRCIKRPTGPRWYTLGR